MFNNLKRWIASAMVWATRGVSFDRLREFLRRTSIAIADGLSLAVFVGVAAEVYRLSYGDFAAHVAATVVEFSTQLNPILGKLLPWLADGQAITSSVGFACLTGVLAIAALTIAAIVAIRSRLEIYSSAERVAEFVDRQKLTRLRRDLRMASVLAANCDPDRLSPSELAALKEAIAESMAQISGALEIQACRQYTLTLPTN